MHITCPNCSTKFSLPDEMFTDGAQARCTVCDEVFPLVNPAEHTIESELEDEISISEMPTAKSEASAVNVGSLVGEGETFGLGEQEQKKSSKTGLVLFLLLVLIGGGGAGAWFLAPDLIKPIVDLVSPTQEKAVEQVTAENDVSRISLKNISQYYITNEKIGQIFIIEGDAENRFNIAKELIKVEATLYDTNNVSIASQQQFGGSGVSLFQLQVLAKEELSDALNNKVEILTNNTNVMPAKSVHFMVVFYDPPKNVAEFGVKVVEAKNPPVQ